MDTTVVAEKADFQRLFAIFFDSKRLSFRMGRTPLVRLAGWLCTRDLKTTMLQCNMEPE
jgi:hypothetical protein